ncbi:MAG: 2-oxoacid:acceptor oxidoreductase subunit alpha, partial [Nitrospinota bacterium]
MSTKNDLIIRIGGEGGEGIISSGDILTQAATRSGLKVLTFKTFPAEIKGGYAMYQLRLSGEPIESQGDGFNAFVAFNEEAYQVNKKLLKEGTVFIYDGAGTGGFEPEDLPGVISYPVPMSKIAKEDLGTYRSKNMVALGAIAHLFSISFKNLEEIITNKFKRKGDEVVEVNLKALRAGKEYVEKELEKKDSLKVASIGEQKDIIVIDGNEAIGLGALLAGCRFFSCYPITPATEIANWLSKFMPKLKGTLIQAEDEIASLGNVLGAAYAGAKAMTSTSGPGLSLMSELLGMACMAEIPCVIVNVQRGGPATGLPTKHEQSDLFLAAHGSHGDSSRIVLACDNVEDCIYLTVEAFNLAEKYQTPVILLSDGSLGMRKEGIKRPDLSKIKTIERLKYKPGSNGNEPFLRYKMTDN